MHSFGILCKVTILSRSCIALCVAGWLSQKNKPGKIIIVYDEDERIAPAVATTFIQREVDNIFMLSGGQCSSVDALVMCSCFVNGECASPAQGS